MHSKSKEFTHGGHRYTIGRLSSFDGSYICTTLLTQKMQLQYQRLAGALGSADPEVAAHLEDESKGSAAPATAAVEDTLKQTANFLISQLTRAEMEEVMTICLKKIVRWEEVGGLPVSKPIIDNHGAWICQDLETEGAVCFELMRQSLAFNIAPFTPAGE